MFQKLIFLTKQQEDFIRENSHNMTYDQLAAHLQISRSSARKAAIRLGCERIVQGVCFERNGYFNVDAFAKLYQY